MVVAAAVLCVCVYMRGCISELDVYKDLCGSKQEKKIPETHERFEVF